MALLAFEDARSSPVADLMDISQRQKTASELNAAILSSQCQVGRRCARSQCDLKHGCACSHNLFISAIKSCHSHCIYWFSMRDCPSGSSLCALCHLHTTILTCHTGKCVLLACIKVCLQLGTNTLQSIC